MIVPTIQVGDDEPLPDLTNRRFNDLIKIVSIQKWPIWSRSRRVKNLTAGIWLIFRGLNFSRNTDIGQIGHFWMGTI